MRLPAFARRSASASSVPKPQRITGLRWLWNATGITRERSGSCRRRASAAQGKVLQQHRYLAESYALYGQNTAAIEQLMLAQKATDGDFYEHSQVDARLRELRAIESAKPRSEQGGGSRLKEYR